MLLRFWRPTRSRRERPCRYACLAPPPDLQISRVARLVGAGPIEAR